MIHISVNPAGKGINLLFLFENFRQASWVIVERNGKSKRFEFSNSARIVRDLEEVLVLFFETAAMKNDMSNDLTFKATLFVSHCSFILLKFVNYDMMCCV